MNVADASLAWVRRCPVPRFELGGRVFTLSYRADLTSRHELLLVSRASAEPQGHFSSTSLWLTGGGRKPRKLAANSTRIGVDASTQAQPESAWRRVSLRDGSMGKLEVEPPVRCVQARPLQKNSTIPLTCPRVAQHNVRCTGALTGQIRASRPPVRRSAPRCLLTLAVDHVGDHSRPKPVGRVGTLRGDYPADTGRTDPTSPVAGGSHAPASRRRRQTSLGPRTTHLRSAARTTPGGGDPGIPRA
jgi:hypothetical protein